MTTPSLTPPAKTPTESQIERQMRLDYEAAEEAYRTNMGEQDRLNLDAASLLRLNRTDINGQRASICCLCLRSFVTFRDSGWRAIDSTTDRRRRCSRRLAGKGSSSD